MFRLIILFFLLISTPLFSQNKEKNISINVFPNPANEYINLKINNDTSVDDYDYSIHSLIGNEMSFIEEKLSDKELRFNLNYFKKGYYFILLDSKKENRRRIIKFSKN